MTIRKSLENRIRGWFPQEPISKEPVNIQDVRVKVDSETKPQPLTIPQGYDVSATKNAGLQSVYFAVLGIVITLLFSFLSKYSFPLTLEVAWVISGLAVGTVSGAMYTRNQLFRLSKNNQVNPNKKDLILLIFPMLILFLTGFFTSSFLYSSYMQQSALLLLLASVFSMGISAQATTYALFSAYEKRKGVRLMRSLVGWRIIVIPKAPPS